MAASPKTSSEPASVRIGIFGGTFNPPHIGHLIIAEQARVQFRLDSVFFVPAYVPPHKTKRTAGSSLSRRKMVALSIANHPGFFLSDFELQRKGISYTVETLREFHKQFPTANFVLILGSDNVSDFSTWKDPDGIRRQAKIAVYERSGSLLRRKKFHTIPVRGPRMDISSSEIRRMVKQGESIRYLVLPAVERFIKRNRLYR